MSARQTVHTFVATFVATIVITGCSPAEKAEAPPAAAPAPEPAQPAPAPIQAGLKWDVVSSGEGSALVLNDAAGEPVMQWACMSGPARLIVRVQPFNPIGSEERLSIGVDNEAYALVAASTKPGPGVQAEGEIFPDLLARLPTATSIAASYGAQTVGPHMPPSKDQADAFVAACRAAK
jgi:hypothetical protein